MIEPTGRAQVSARPHWPALDGLRGTAILAVLICHYSALLPKSASWTGVLQNGWAGVDLFFVLSGFLITDILFDAKGTRHYFRNFYARRVLRIFPLYYGFLAALLLVLLFSGMAEWSRQLRAAQPWLWTYTVNFWIPAQTKWNDGSDSIMPLWSLSVEEQFYLVWPLVVFCFSLRALIRICMGIMVGALLLRLILAAHGTSWFALYTWTPTRADSLAAGALLALLMQPPDAARKLRKIAGYGAVIAGLLLLLACPGFDPTRHPWLRDFLYSLLAIFFAVILFWSIDPGSLRGLPMRFYERQILRIIGRYSYGIYVLHLPLMYLSRAALVRWHVYDPERTSWATALGLIVLNVMLTSFAAAVSYHFYEKQFLKLKQWFPQ
jgi:peptidoglycan/LPS O-acetylase OafA/YrhL